MEEKSPPVSAKPSAATAALATTTTAPGMPVAVPRPMATGQAQMSPEEVAELFRAIGAVASSKEVVGTIKAIVARIKEIWAALRPAFAAMGTAAMFLVDAMRQWPNELRASVLALANRGWFLDPKMPLTSMWQMKALIEAGKPEDADAYMAAHFESRLDEIEAKLAVALPPRASKFKSAFAAHRRGEYDLSILAFIAQADGVCAELRGGYFFLRNRATGKPEAAAYAAAAGANFILEIANLALVEDLPIREQMRHRLAKGSTDLNRHAVMHGESLDHDTKENSLRALSLLNYVALGLDIGAGTALDIAGKTPFGSIATIAAESNATMQNDGVPVAPKAQPGA